MSLVGARAHRHDLEPAAERGRADAIAACGLGGVQGAIGALEQAVDAAIASTGAASAKDMGRVMKAVMAALAGQTVDGKAVNELVRKKLGQ